MSLPPLARYQQPMGARVVDDLVRSLLVRLAEVEEPLEDTGLCLLCGVTIIGSRTHDETCPWRQARELLGLEVP